MEAFSVSPLMERSAFPLASTGSLSSASVVEAGAEVVPEILLLRCAKVEVAAGEEH